MVTTCPPECPRCRCRGQRRCGCLHSTARAKWQQVGNPRLLVGQASSLPLTWQAGSLPHEKPKRGWTMCNPMCYNFPRCLHCRPRVMPMEKVSVYQDCEQEAAQFKWIESEKA